MIVISSATAIREIVDKTGWSASGRPPLYLANAGNKYLLWMSDCEGFNLLRDTYKTLISRQQRLNFEQLVIWLLFSFRNRMLSNGGPSVRKAPSCSSKSWRTPTYVLQFIVLSSLYISLLRRISRFASSVIYSRSSRSFISVVSASSHTHCL